MTLLEITTLIPLFWVALRLENVAKRLERLEKKYGIDDTSEPVRNQEIIESIRLAHETELNTPKKGSRIGY